MTIWEAADNEGIYAAKVIRLGDYDAELILSKKGEIVRREPVTLAYRAIAGPDVSDVNEWNRKVEAWMDELEKAKL